MSSSDSTVFILGEHTEVDACEKFIVGAWTDALVNHQKIEVEIRPYVPKRSNLANRYYWEILSQAAEQTGYTKDELHLFMRHKFLGAAQKEIMGQNFNALPSTADLDAKKFSNYVRDVERFILESGFDIKAPPYRKDIWND